MIGARVALLAVLIPLSCGGDPDPDLAELTEILSGSAERSPQGKPWQVAAAGNRFRGGDGVRTSADGSARLRFLAGGGLRMGPSTTIRFGGEALAVEGELEAEGEETLSIQLEVGRATIAAGTRVKIGRRGKEVRFDVLVGRAVVSHGDEEMEVTAGQAVAVAEGRPAMLDTIDPPDAGASRPVITSGTESPPAIEPAGAVQGEVRGAPARIRGADGTWRELTAGKHELAAGAELSLPRGSSLALTREDEQALIQGPAELVVAPPGGALAETRRGRAQVRAVAADVAIRVPGGMIVARRGTAGGSRAELGVERGETSVAVTAGVVDVSGDQGGAERLLTGQSGAVERGGGLRVLGRPPERADFSIAAGLTATIHDPAPPTDVKIRFDTLCREAGVLELAHGESFRAARVMVQGRGAAIGRFPRGAHRYRVRCFEGDVVGDVVVASGRLRVTRDSGTRPLALGAPHNTVDADGRRYTVLYQNRLPAITFRWPGAPEAARYRLVVAPTRGRRIEVDLASTTHGMNAGALAEGQYRFWFNVAGSAQESRKSTLRIDFDNAARSGYVMAPRPDAPWRGPTVTVGGAAIEGWRVAVGGAALELDRQHRFSGEVRRADDENGIALEFSHPSHGVHLYVRRGVKR